MHILGSISSFAGGCKNTSKGIYQMHAVLQKSQIEPMG